MSNLFQTTSSGSAELKIFYAGPIRDQMNETCTILRVAERVNAKWTGSQVAIPLRTSRNQGIGATTDGGTLPAIGRQVTQQAIVTAKYNYLRCGVTGPMIKASASDAGSFVRAAAYEMSQGAKDFSSDINRQLSWDGSGTLALANANTAGSTSLVIKGRESTEAALKFVDVNLVFDVVSGGAVVQSGIQVNSISAGTPSSTTATLVLSAPVTCTAGDSIVRSGSYGNEIQGLLYGMDGLTTTIYNINRATTISYQGNVFDLASGQLTLAQMQNAYNAALQRGGAKLDGAFMDYTSLAYYQKLLTPDKRYVNTQQGDGTFGKKDQFYMEFMGLPCVADKDCPTRIFFLDSSTLQNFVQCDMEWADETGSVYIAQTSSDSLELRFRYFTNLFNAQPSANAVLKTYISP